MSNLSQEVLRNYIKDQSFTSVDEVITAMKDMFKDVLQEALEVEMDTYLGYDKYDISDKQTRNSRNGYSSKTIKTELGPVKLSIPRDRNGEFKSKIVPKYQRNVTGIVEKILAFYALGMTTRDITEQVKNLYDIDISPETVSNITNRIICP